MAKRKEENLIIFNKESIQMILHKKQKGPLQNKKAKDYLNLTKDIECDKITNKIIKGANKINYKKYAIIIKFIILINLFIKTFPTHKIFSIDFYFSNITLKIKGTGYNKIFCSNTGSFLTDYYPNLVYINGNKQDSINFQYNFIEAENVVKLVWNNRIKQNENMFKDCINITEVDLSEFDTSEVTQMSSMFYGCTSLTSINFDNINISQLIYIGYMFDGCSSLLSINFSNFKTSKLKSIRYTFARCSSLTSLDLSNFDTSEVTFINNMFDGCNKLEYINMKNFNEKEVLSTDKADIFKQVPDNIVVCINEEINKNKIIPQLKDKKCYNIDCSDNWKSKQKKIINSVNGCECELNNCLSCSNLILGENKRICTTCPEHFYPLENSPQYHGSDYFECYKNPVGYYLDTHAFVYKKCFDTCESCEIIGNHTTHNCLTCNNNFPVEINYNNYINCYEECTYFYYFDNEYHCTINSSCPNEYPKLLPDKKECIKDNNIIIKDALEKIKKEEKKEGEKEEIKYYDKILETIEDIFTSNDFDTFDIDKGEDQVIEAEKIKITLTSTQNQKDNINKKMTIIDLGECETRLKKHYNISNNETLYMEKIDVKQEGMKIPKIEYNVYSKLSGNKLEKLNLSICGDNKIFLSIPIIITESLDKLNASSEYYKNLCSKSKSESGTDILLKDRQKEFVEGNKTICQEKCDFSEYNYDNQKANCSCQVKEASNTYANMNIDKAKLYENFADDSNKKSISNLGITSCDILSSTENIKSNTGFYLLLIILAIFIIIFIIFCSKGYDLLERKMDEVINKKFKNKSKNKINNNNIININANSNLIQFNNRRTKKKKNKNKSKAKNKDKNNLINNKIEKKNNNDLLIKTNNNKRKSRNKIEISENKRKKSKKAEESNLKPNTDYEFN